MTDAMHNEPAERSVLGAMLMAPDTIPDVCQKVAADDFYKPRHTLIFKACVDLFNKQEPVDATTVCHQLQRQGDLVRVGGAPYLLDLLQETPTAANATYYAGVVAECAKLRDLDDLCTRGKKLVAEGGAGFQEIIDQFSRYMDEANLANDAELQGFSDVFDDWVSWQNSPVPALPTPWPKVNDVLAGGFHRQRVYICAARPGCGKSVLGLNAATQIAKAGYKGIIFSLEMPKMEVMSRLLAAGAHADYGQITRHAMDKDSFAAVNKFVAMYPEFQSNIMIDDQTDHTIESIAQVASAQKRKGLDFIFIDYIQLLNSNAHGQVNRYQELGQMSKFAKHLSRKLDIAVLIAAQAGRQQDDKKHVPTMGDLRESGNLEADADAVIMLSRGGDVSTPDLPLVTVSIVKNRTGQTDMFTLPEHFEQARIGV